MLIRQTRRRSPGVRTSTTRTLDRRPADGAPRPRGSTPGLDPPAILRLQRAIGNAGVAGLLGETSDAAPARSVRAVLSSGGGTPLEDHVRRSMEARFGQDFGDVRVHSDSLADRSARAVNAHAYTAGNHIVFRDDRYRPNIEAGLRMLAHELTHVVQQRSGRVPGTTMPGGLRVSHPSDPFEREADLVAARVFAGPDGSRGLAPAPLPAPPPERRPATEGSLQRAHKERECEEDEDDHVQRLAAEPGGVGGRLVRVQSLAGRATATRRVAASS